MIIKLKTLKDLAGNGILANNEFVFDYDEDGESGYVLYNDPIPILKKAAIEWIKKLRKKAIPDPGKLSPIWYDAQIDWIIHFFNIDEEDLK